jgi:hypothetical protein
MQSATAKSTLFQLRSLCLWHAARNYWSERRWFRIPPHRVALNLFREAQLSVLPALPPGT